MASSNSLDPSSPDCIVDGVDMKELKRRKRQLEHQLAEKQKQEQVVKVEIPTIASFLFSNVHSLSSGYSQYISIDRNRSDSTFYCSRYELFRQLSSHYL